MTLPDHARLVVVGGGPVGLVSALAFARRHADADVDIVVLEANPKASRRLAGEWLHPPALAALASLGITLPPITRRYDTGRGFVVYPEDGSPAIRLPYPRAQGLGVEHSVLVDCIRAQVRRHPRVRYVPHARLVGLTDGVGRSPRYSLEVAQRRAEGPSETRTLTAEQVVGADGRSSKTRQLLGQPARRVRTSRMLGLLLSDVSLPDEGFGHVFLGGPGPALAYRVLPDAVRLTLDIPRGHRMPSGPTRARWLYDAFAPALPEQLRAPFTEALNRGTWQWAHGDVGLRDAFGAGQVALVGDAVGYYHPLTGMGMTLGFGDALSFAEHSARFDVAGYEAERRAATKVPELLSLALYDVFSEQNHDAAALRAAMYRSWRTDESETQRTMSYLACEDTSVVRFARSFGRVARQGAAAVTGTALRTGDLAHASSVTRALVTRAAWVTRTIAPGAAPSVFQPSARHAASADVSGDHVAPVAAVAQPQWSARTLERLDGALDASVRALASVQRQDGGFEGEVVWCPMLAAQYVMAAELLRSNPSAARRAAEDARSLGEEGALGAIAPERARRILLHFADTQRADGLWALHPHAAAPNLFVTTLVYVAARLLGERPQGALLCAASAFIEREGGVVGIPSWGKLWLALLGLYDWRGVHPVLAEAWLLPEKMPLHPHQFYCHTRHIALGMGVLSAMRVTAPDSPLRAQVRRELHPRGYARSATLAARDTLRPGDILSPPGAALRALYAVSAVVDRVRRGTEGREALLDALNERIRWELRTTDHTSLSPVSGLLNVLALWARDPNGKDPEVPAAWERLDAWFWEDDERGSRIAGARSATWDTAFAAQALSVAAAAGPRDTPLDHALTSGLRFLGEQQIRTSFNGYQSAGRIDPRGGYCFAERWHGWPVSDCTAEAVLAFLHAPERWRAQHLNPQHLTEATRFILRTQHGDGGFGSYEARKSDVPLEWLNPAEMFSESMTEHSYVECTASCVAALAAYRDHQVSSGREAIPNAELEQAIGRAASFLRDVQNPDGSWTGVWGVLFTYGTMFGVRGLTAGGVPTTDPSVQRARRWLLDRQRPDGGWGEHPESATTGVYRAAPDSHVVQTSWALTALLEAGEPDAAVLSRAAEFLTGAQLSDGRWPRQAMTGLFFRSALLEYELYRSYFPLWALSLYRARVAECVTSTSLAHKTPSDTRRTNEPAVVARPTPSARSASPARRKDAR